MVEILAVRIDKILTDQNTDWLPRIELWKASTREANVRWLIALALLEGWLAAEAVITALMACAGNGC
jgi:hypothetical protein